MNLINIRFILSLMLLAGGAMAETPSHQLLTYPFSSRSAAMGGSRAVDASGNIDLQGNPASASFVQGLQGQAGFVNHLVGIQGFAAGGVLPLERHRISGELIYFDYGLFNRTDIVGTNQGTFGYHELAAALGYAFKFSEGIRMGGRVGRSTRVADGSTSGDFYYDLGGVYHNLQDSLTVGVYLASIALGESDETFPTQLHIGSSKILSHLPLRLNLEGIYGFNEQIRFALGGEIMIHPNFRVRLGVNSNRFDLQTGVTESDFIAGASGGFAIDWQGMLIESATQSFGATGWVSQISIAYHL
ncbi:MAG: hypothetical protein HOD43_00280 [Candidatus Marinimicrobia bacterium]|nr:hypothetical protein [Candidatus Neomarinimicrobiota bacterium]MBT3632395.1 hypothetical protein [Candidatus Neomarinimicrobiota bacterium]MBT3825843.1 hypothetical protein [Candidatus Neomarinimicrobiota bacterium]MBT4129929.1 hypothetical protein [Candidatus Neomarinimicrobiota bacterium]MBT4294224.1 hypothetical protein [Candidatus Neomarinimicrobiota bacterium]